MACTRCGETKPTAQFWNKRVCRVCEQVEFKNLVALLDERYVRRLMAKTSSVLKGSDIPLALVQAKQAQLRILRFLKQSGDGE
jgi:hypothetical protein